ncbi:MAG: OmpA family protein [Bacteroidales bacterium]|nr:OmpA family protein [Bacteroidales bacterium]
MRPVHPLYRCIRVICLVSLFSFFYPAAGQVIVPRPEDIYEEAEQYVFAGDYQEALASYMSLYEKGYTTANISYKIGTCYLNLSGLRTKAIHFLHDASRHASRVYSGGALYEARAPVKSFLYLGIAHRINYDFDLAEKAFLTYVDSLDETDVTGRALAQYHLERCENARELIASPATLKADTLPGVINNRLSNFNPLVTDDEKILFFNEQLKFYDAVMVSHKEDYAWSVPENITPKIRSDGDHYLTGISQNGDRLLLSAHDPYMSGTIYEAENINGRWRPLKVLNDNINTRFNETHASFSKDGNTLYFTSDRPGGYGGLDLYKSERNGTGNWGPAQNLGPLVNTPYNEETPFVTGDPVILFFSSQGHYNMGGYDIFFSRRFDDGAWQHPVNIGYPVNTPDDDLFYYPLPSGEAAYKPVLHNIRADPDIVRYQILEPGKPARYTINGNIEIEDQNGAGYSDILVSVFTRPENDTIGRHHPDDNGTFSQKVPGGSFTLEITQGGYPVYSRELEIPSYFPHKELVLNASVSLPFRSALDTLILRNIRFDFDQSDIRDKARTFLDGLAMMLNKYPEITVTLNGYTDAVGSESYNVKLSLERASNARDFLSGRNIVQNRLMINGFGENYPVALNTTPDGSDVPEGRAYNRRVEIVLENIPENLTIIKGNDIPENLLIK